MKPSKTSLHELTPLANAVGEFIQYWGFKSIQGRVWTLIYLSKTPLSPQEISNALGTSKTLLSFAIQDLLSYKLIKPAKSENQKTKRFVAEEDVFGVIIGILKNREWELIQQAQKEQDLVVDRLDQYQNEVNSAKLQMLGLMIAQAKIFLKETIKLEHEALKPFKT
jgi:DNA-binding transcriptional regulator GbsR (MarR family)